jgi:trigger factor
MAFNAALARTTSVRPPPSILRGKRGAAFATRATTRCRVVVSVTAGGVTEVTVNKVDLGDCKVRLEVTVPNAIATAARAECLVNFAEKSEIPGFVYAKKSGRKKSGSNVPPPADAIIAFVGAKEFKASCVEEMLQRSIPDAMAVVAATALQDSERIETPFDTLLKAFDNALAVPEGDIKYSIVCEVVPQIVWTGDYRKLAVTVVAPGDDISDEMEATSQFNNQLRNLGTMRVVVDRGLEVGDQVVMSLDAVDQQTRLPIEGIKQEKFSLDTGAAKINLPGLVDGLMGMKTGGTKTFPITMPTDWPQEFIRGVTADFTVTIKELFDNEVPAPTDDIADKIVEGATSIEDAKEKLLTMQKENTKAQLERVVDVALLDALAAICEAPLPFSIVEETGRQMYSEQMLEMQMSGNLDMATVEKIAAPEMVEKFLLESRLEIEQVVRRTVACEELFKLENIDVTEEEFKNEVVAAKQEFEKYGTEYDVQRLVEQAGETIEARKSLEWLRANAEITVTPPVA